MEAAEIPEILGYPLGGARKILNARSLDIISIEITAPPRVKDTAWNEESRVIRAEISKDGKVSLLVCNV